MNKKIIFIISTLLVVTSAAVLVYAATYYTVNNGATVTVSEHLVCKKVTNGAGLGIFVPTNTAAEFTAFRTNKPAGVTLSPCCFTYTLTEGLVTAGFNQYGYRSGTAGAISPNTYLGIFIPAVTTTNFLSKSFMVQISGNRAQDFFSSAQPYAGAATYYTSAASWAYESVGDYTYWSWIVPAGTTYDGVGTSTVTICS